ncbi:MAG: phosphate acyltransferase PlsX [Pseudomonadota bacterium]
MTGVVISVDAMGGDGGPGPVLGGLSRALRKVPDLRFIIHGDRAILERILRRRRHTALREACTLRHADDVVLMADKPARALRERRQSSMWSAIEAVKAGEAPIAVSCGNTGALLAMSVLILRKAPGIDRPAIAVHWPSAAPHGFTTVLDVGADVRAGPRGLVQYAVMGAEYARASFGIERPRIGFLNVGTEKTKGPPELHLAAETVTAAVAEGVPYQVAGFVEGTDIAAASVDVVVTDGFTGNIALKTAEGTASFIRQGLKEAFQHTILSRMGSLFAFTSLRRFQKRIDPRRVNGGVFLGLNGMVVKSHGRADAVGIEAAVRLAVRIAERDVGAAAMASLERFDLRALPHGHASAQWDDPSAASSPSQSDPATTPSTSVPGGGDPLSLASRGEPDKTAAANGSEGS